MVHNEHNESEDPSNPPDDENSNGGSGDADEDEEIYEGEMSLVDELGVEDLTDILFAERGRIFSAAGRDAPVAEFHENGVVLRPAQLPFQEDGEQEVIVYKVDQRGVLLNELGEPRRIVGARFRGAELFTLGDTKPGTVKHYAAWFDDNNKPHKLFVQGEPLTADMIFRIRNRTHDGEIGIFPEITTD